VPEYRLDELASLSGLSARNIRAYRERGLLDPPRREGRSAFYDDRHLTQLRIINELLRKGFTSAHIAEFLSSMRDGQDLADVLGLQPNASAPRRDAAVAVDVDPDGDDGRRLVQYGLAEVIDGRLTLVDPAIAEIVARVGDPLRCVQTMLRICDGIAGPVADVAATVHDALAADVPPEVADDYRAIGARIAAGQLESAVRRRLTGGPTDVSTGGDGDAEDR
jgi:DNA-binding transcriptional MerR regulator